MSLSVLDFEASGIAGDSYPIEVAWSLPDGSIRNCLIRPEAHWTHWDVSAEEFIHGISRDELQRSGQPVRWVAEQMNADLAGRTVYADSPMDTFWLETLFTAARRVPAFDLEDLFTRIPPLSDAEIAHYQTLARRATGGPAHRAAADVRYLLEFHRLANARPA